MPRPSANDDINNTIDPTNGIPINEKIYYDLNPERRGSSSGSSDGRVVHNYGQPNRPPYATNSISDGATITTTTTNKAATAFLTNCAKEHRESLQCIERNYQNRSACQDFFEAYKQCRKDERKEQGVANAINNQQNNKSGWWFW
jgi:hypothetical protein